MHPTVFLGLLLLAAPGWCLLPGHGWATLSEQVFFHRCNVTGWFTDGANAVIAKHKMVTIEKRMNLQNDEDMADNILEALNQVKAVNPNVTAILYMNSVCDFPQFHSLYNTFNAMPENWLRNKAGDPIKKNCAGFSDMPVFDFSVPAVRDLWSSVCLNATNAGADGCFIDRAVNGTPTNAINQAAYDAGHLQLMQDLQKSVGPNKVIIANHGYSTPDVNSAMIEACTPSESTIMYMQECEKNKKICQCHGTADNYRDVAVAYLIGAYSGDAYASYFGFGHWRGSVQFDAQWTAETLPDFYYKPLGVPLSRAVKDGDVWTRKFANATVTFNVTSGTGNVSTW